MPAFAQVQYKFRETRFTPFVNLQVGYQVPLEKESRQNFNNYYVDYSSSYWPGYQTNQNWILKVDFLLILHLGFSGIRLITLVGFSLLVIVIIN